MCCTTLSSKCGITSSMRRAVGRRDGGAVASWSSIVVMPPAKPRGSSDDSVVRSWAAASNGPGHGGRPTLADRSLRILVGSRLRDVRGHPATARNPLPRERGGVPGNCAPSSTSTRAGQGRRDASRSSDDDGLVCRHQRTRRRAPRLVGAREARCAGPRGSPRRRVGPPSRPSSDAAYGRHTRRHRCPTAVRSLRRSRALGGGPGPARTRRPRRTSRRSPGSPAPGWWQRRSGSARHSRGP